MENAINLVKEIEVNLTKHMTGLVQKLKNDFTEEAYKGIETMYDIKPLEGVKYDKCVMIPYTGNYYHYAPYRLPENEYVISVSKMCINRTDQYGSDTICCSALTNYGRILDTTPVYCSRDGYASSKLFDDNHIGEYHNKKQIKVCEPLAYKIPKVAFDLGCGQSIPVQVNADENSYKEQFERIQQINKEFYNYIGKWQSFMKDNITVNVDEIRATNESQKKNITIMESQIENLIETNKRLEEELDKVKKDFEEYKEEQKDYKELVKWKELFIGVLNRNIDIHRNKDKSLKTVDEINNILEYHIIIPESDWDEACEAMDEMEEFKKFQEMQKKYGNLGVNVTNKNKNISIGKKK